MPRRKQTISKSQQTLPASTGIQVAPAPPSPVAAPSPPSRVYVNQMIEQVKTLSLLSQLCTYVTTLRLNKQTDDEIVNELNSLFAFTGKTLNVKDWKKVLCSYIDIRRAYLRGSIDNVAALYALTADSLTEYIYSHPDDAKTLVAWNKNLGEVMTEREKIKTAAGIQQDALRVSETTRATLATIAESLSATDTPDFTSPGAEEEEWDNRQEDI